MSRRRVRVALSATVAAFAVAVGGLVIGPANAANAVYVNWKCSAEGAFPTKGAAVRNINCTYAQAAANGVRTNGSVYSIYGSKVAKNVWSKTGSVTSPNRLIGRAAKLWVGAQQCPWTTY